MRRFNSFQVNLTSIDSDLIEVRLIIIYSTSLGFIRNIILTSEMMLLVVVKFLTGAVISKQTSPKLNVHLWR